MKKLSVLFALFLASACATTPSDNATVSGARSTASSRDIKEGELAYSGACDPRVMDGAPLEIYIDTEKDTLTLVRDGKPVHGYPVKAITSGFPEMKAQSPTLIKNKYNASKKKKYKQAIVLNKTNVIHGTEYADYYQRWAKGQKKIYKAKKTGNVYVSPRHMGKIYTCAKRFGAANVKVTTVQ